MTGWCHEIYTWDGILLTKSLSEPTNIDANGEVNPSSKSAAKHKKEPASIYGRRRPNLDFDRSAITPRKWIH